MKQFEIQYKEYLKAFRRYTILGLEREEKEDKGIVESDDDFRCFVNSHDSVVNSIKAITEVFLQELDSNELNYALVFQELLHDAVVGQNWERFLLVKDLYQWPLINGEINEVVCNSINLILSLDELTTVYGERVCEWCKGTFLEYLIGMLQAKDNLIVINTLKRVLCELAQDNIENVHAINLAKGLMSEINK